MNRRSPRDKHTFRGQRANPRRGQREGTRLPADLWVTGFHAVDELWRNDWAPKQILLQAQGRMRLEELAERATEAGIPCRWVDGEELAARAGEGVSHQGVIACFPPIPMLDDAELVSLSREGGYEATGSKGLWVALDGVQDPQNLGAIVRSATALGAAGIILPERQSCGLTSAVVRASAGAIARLPIAQVKNLTRALTQLKKDGYWIVGAAGDAEDSEEGKGTGKDPTSFDACVPLVIVLGGEGRGLRRLVRETCDAVVAIPMPGGFESLNVSVAAGILLYEAIRQRRQSEIEQSSKGL